MARSGTTKQHGTRKASSRTSTEKPASTKRTPTKSTARRTADERATSTKTTTAKRSPTKSTRRAAKAPVETIDLEKELTVENLLARAADLEAERAERAESERDNTRAVRPPVAVRPANPVHWGYSYCFDEAVPADERAALRTFFKRFTEVADERGSGFYVVAADTEPEARRAAWDAGGVVIELEQLRAQLPPDDVAARRERLARALARPTGEGWYEAAMLLSTWDDATRPAALAEAERLLASWPDELRSKLEPWTDRPELLRLVRVHWGPIAEHGTADGVTVVHTQDPDGLQRHQQRFAAIRTLAISGRPGLPAVVAGCTGLANLERLALQQPTYTAGTSKIDLAELLAAPHLQRLTGLSLYGYTLSDADLAALAACAQPLEHLRIEYASMKPKAADALASLASRRRLRTLDLKYNDLGPKGASALFSAADDWRSLRVLDISANEIGDPGVQALARASLDELRWLNISSNDPKNQLGPAAARALADAPALGNLETLILHGHPLGAEGVAALLYSPCLRSLRRLNVAFSGASLAGLVACAGPGEPLPLTELNLGFVAASKQGKKTPLDLSGARFLRSVRTLNLDSLDGAEYAAVLSCPHLESLEVLVLGGGHSNPRAAFTALCSIEPPPRLRYLGLSGWRFTAEQARALAASPLGRRLWGLELMASYTVPDAWYEFYRAGLPLVGSPFFDAYAPNEHVTTTIFREEI